MFAKTHRMIHVRFVHFTVCNHLPKSPIPVHTWSVTINKYWTKWARYKRIHVNNKAAAAAKSLQSYPTLLDPIDGSPLGSSVSRTLQARILEWVAISFSNAWKWKVKSLSRVRLLATPWTAAYQAPPSMGFSRQEYWSGVPLPSPEEIQSLG